MTRQAILEMANKISRFYDDMAEANKMVRICGYGEGYRKGIHIFKSSDIFEIADIMNLTPILDCSSNIIEVVIKGVHFYSSYDKSEESKMKTVLMSITAENNANIESRRKRAELRTRPPKLTPPFKVLTYESGKNGRHKVVNEWICREMRTYQNGDYPSALSAVACVPMSYINKYTADGKKELTAMYITDLKIYHRPMELWEFRTPCKMRGKLCGTCDCAVLGNYGDLIYCNTSLTRPPQSWCYVESEGAE